MPTESVRLIGADLEHRILMLRDAARHVAEYAGSYDCNATTLDWLTNRLADDAEWLHDTYQSWRLGRPRDTTRSCAGG